VIVAGISSITKGIVKLAIGLCWRVYLNEMR